MTQINDDQRSGVADVLERGEWDRRDKFHVSLYDQTQFDKVAEYEWDETIEVFLVQPLSLGASAGMMLLHHDGSEIIVANLIDADGAHLSTITFHGGA